MGIYDDNGDDYADHRLHHHMEMVMVNIILIMEMIMMVTIIMMMTMAMLMVIIMTMMATGVTWGIPLQLLISTRPEGDTEPIATDDRDEERFIRNVFMFIVMMIAMMIVMMIAMMIVMLIKIIW